MLDTLCYEHETYMKLDIWTDGGFSFNNNVGSWSFLLFNGNKDVRIERYGIVEHTKQTSQVAEMMAILKSLEFVADTLCGGCAIKAKEVELDITTDSQYCTGSINEWMEGWKNAGWPASKKNCDLWRIIYALKQKFKRVTVHWVKGHSGVELNERVDHLNQLALIEKGLR